MKKWNTIIITSIAILALTSTLMLQAQGLNVYDDVDIFTAQPAEVPKAQISQVVRMMFQDSKGTLWFGTQNGAFKLKDSTLIQIEGIKNEYGQGVTIMDICEDKTGTIWLGHDGGISSIKGEEVTTYYPADGLLSRDVWSIEADSQGRIWIGTYDGLCFFDGQSFINFELPEGIIDTTLGISSTKMVHCILEDHKGGIWFCTNAGLFNYSNDILTNVSEQVGIQTNFINQIIESKQGGFWISTKEAIYKLENGKIHNISNNIPNHGKGAGSMVEDKDGLLWFVFNQHDLYRFDGKELSQFEKTEDNKGPVVYRIFKDESKRLWFIGFGGAYRLEQGRFVNITKDGPW